MHSVWFLSASLSSWDRIAVNKCLWNIIELSQVIGQVAKDNKLMNNHKQ